MFQKVQIIGNLGGDPESRQVGQTNVCSFSIATNRKWTNNDGSQGEETVWWRVSAWGRLGEICQQYLTRGRLVFIEGTMVPDRETGGPSIWTDQNGQPRASFELRAETMKMLGGGRDDNAGYDREESFRAPAAAPTSRQATPAASSGQGRGNQGQGQGQGQRGQGQGQGQPQRQPQNSGGRRSTMSAPQNTNYDDDDFGPDEIPF